MECSAQTGDGVENVIEEAGVLALRKVVENEAGELSGRVVRRRLV